MTLMTAQDPYETCHEDLLTILFGDGVESLIGGGEGRIRGTSSQIQFARAGSLPEVAETMKVHGIPKMRFGYLWNVDHRACGFARFEIERKADGIHLYPLDENAEGVEGNVFKNPALGLDLIVFLDPAEHHELWC